MIEQSKLLKITAAFIIVSLLFGLLSFLKIRYQFYLWEILIDLKIVCVIGVTVYSFRRNEIAFDPSQRTFFAFDWKKNILWFAVPLLAYAVTIGSGLAAGEMKLNKMENAVTLGLATLFDIPAIYVFSVTSILIEEILFRGILLRSYAQTSGNYRSVLIVSILWTLFMISDIIGGELFDATESAVLTLYFLSVGVLVTSLSLWRGNVWFGYSLRIGLITLTPIILTSRINESDSFFNSGSLLFIAEGVVVSMVLILLAAIVLINFRKNSSISID